MLADESTAIVEIHQVGTNTVAIPLGDGDRELLGTDLACIPPTGRRVDVTGVVVLTTTRGRVSAERHHWPKHWFSECLGSAHRRHDANRSLEDQPFVPGTARRRLTKHTHPHQTAQPRHPLFGDRR